MRRRCGCSADEQCALLLQGYQGMRDREAQMPLHARIDLIQDLQRLVDLYDVSGNKAEADQWRKALEARIVKQKS